MSAYVTAVGARSRPLRLPISQVLIYLLVVAFPFFSVEPTILRPDWWVGSLLILAFTFRVFLNGRLRLDHIARVALGLHAAVLLSVAVNFWNWKGPQWLEFSTLWLQFLFATLLYLALVNLKISQEQLRSVLRLWIFVAVIVSLYGLYQVLARNLDWPLAYLPYLHPVPTKFYLEWGLGFSGYVRPSSFLREPSYLGNYLLGPLLVTAILLFLGQDRLWLFRSRLANHAALWVILLALLSSFAVSTYLTLALVFLVGWLLDRRASRLFLRMGMLLLAIMTALILIFQMLEIPFINALWDRGARIIRVFIPSEGMPIDSSTRTRFGRMLFGLNVWIHHPMFGVGLNQLQFVGTQYAPAGFYSQAVEEGVMHSIWLEILAQTGMVGFIFFSFMWIRGLQMMRETFSNAEDRFRGLALAFWYVLVATMIRGFMDSPSFILPQYWFYLGMTSIIYNASRRCGQ